VSPCSSVTPANECKGYSFKRHVGEHEFSIRVIVYNAPAGKSVELGLVSPGTGANLINPNRFTTDGHRTMVFVIKITSSGGVSRTDAEITVKYEGKPIKFKPPAVIRWR
jgi:hypothetical protein